jgi:hypothetical protein
MTNGIDSNQNIPVFEYSTPDGPGYISASNIPRGLHSEGVIDNYLKSVGIDPNSVTLRVPTMTSALVTALASIELPS